MTRTFFIPVFRIRIFWCGSGPRSESADPLPGIVYPTPEPKKFKFFSSYFFCKWSNTLNDIFVFCNSWPYYSCVLNEKGTLKKKYILIILVDFYVNLSQFFLLPVSDSTLPEVDPDPDPAKWYGSDRIRIQIRNTALYWLDHSFYWRAVLYWWRDLSDILMWLFFLLQGRFYTDDGTALFTDGTVLLIGIPFFFCPVCRKSCPVSKSNDPISIKNVYSVKRAVLLVKKT